MTMRPDPDSGQRGGAAVGRLCDLPPVEALAVICLRLWCSGEDGRQRLSQDLRHMLDADQADRLTESFGELCSFCLTYGRRPLMHHQLACPCLGADESWFANLLGAASDVAREDMVMLATTYLRTDAAFALWPLAAQVGLGLRRATLRVGASECRLPARSLH